MAYQLMLIEDVESLGRKGELVSVRAGYARNFLLPQKAAVVATPQALRRQAKLREERAKQAVVDRQESEAIAARLNGAQFAIVVKVDQEGHMYGSVSHQDIVDLIAAEKGVTLVKRAVARKHAIKEIGNHKVLINLKEGVTAEIVVEVQPDIQIASKAEKVAAPVEKAAEA